MEMTDIWSHKKKSLILPSKKPMLSDYRLAITGDKKGVHINVLCYGNPVNQFSLLKPDYVLWKKMTQDQQYNFVRTRLSDNAFGDIDIINAVIFAICSILNEMFVEGKKMQQRRRV